MCIYIYIYICLSSSKRSGTQRDPATAITWGGPQTPHHSSPPHVAPAVGVIQCMAYMYIYIYIYTYTYIHTYIHTYICMCIYIYIYMYTLYLSLCISTAAARIHKKDDCPRRPSHPSSQSYIHTYTHTHIHTYTHIHIHNIYIYIYIHVYIHIYASQYATPAVGVIQCTARQRPHTRNTALRSGLHTLHTKLRKTFPKRRASSSARLHGGRTHTHTNTDFRGDLRTLHHNTYIRSKRRSHASSNTYIVNAHMCIYVYVCVYAYVYIYIYI